jgi:hypothetical protein
MSLQGLKPSYKKIIKSPIILELGLFSTTPNIIRILSSYWLAQLEGNYKICQWAEHQATSRPNKDTYRFFKFFEVTFRIQMVEYQLTVLMRLCIRLFFALSG